MDDEEDDVFEPDTNCNWQHTTYREIKCKDQGTQTHGPTPANGMLPCGVAEEPRQLFIGNAGYRLHFPAHFELGGDQGSRQQEREAEEAVEEDEEEEEEEPSGPEEGQRQRQPWGHSMEAHIGQKLRLVADQFHREHVRLYHRNQRHHGPLWWRLASTLLSLLFDRGRLAGRGGAGRR